MPPCMKGRAASLEFLFLREKVPFACCVGEMGFALLYRGAGFGLRRAETGKAGMFRPFFVSCVESAKGWGWLYVEKVASGKHLFVLKRHFYERCALAKKGRYAIPGRKNLKEAIMIDFKVDESLCVSCGACVKDCLHQALRMDTYPVMVDEGHCIRCQHCLAVCPTGAVSIMGAAASDCTPLAGNIPEPRQLDTLFKGRRSVRHYKRENVSPGLLQELLDSAAYAPTGSNAQNLLVSVVDDIAAMDAFREAVYLRLDELAETGAMPDCQRRAFFLSAGKLWKAGGWDGIFRSAPHCVIVANAKNATCVEQDPLIYLSYFELMAQARGIGTLWCGLLYWCLRDVLPDFLPRLGIPDTHQLGYAMLFGYPSINYRRTVEARSALVRHIGWN